MKTFRSFSSRETRAIGEKLAKKIKSVRSGAMVFALQGDLGAGKTTFVQGFFKGLKSGRRAQSPTFIIMRRHTIARNKAGFKHVFHVDAYRLKKADQLNVLEFHDILAKPENVILIEWPERIKSALPAKTQWIFFRHGKNENERSITIKSQPRRSL